MNQKDILYINLIPESDKMVQLVCQETYRKLQLRAPQILISGRESKEKEDYIHWHLPDCNTL